MKLKAYVGIGCAARGEVEADTLEECVDKAWEEFGNPFICHHCSKGMELSDPFSLFLEDENGVEVYEDSPSIDEARRTKGMIDYIEELKAEIEKLKGVSK